MDSSYYIEDDYWFDPQDEPYLQKAIKARNEAYMQNPCGEVFLDTAPTSCALPMPEEYKCGDIFTNEHGFWILAQCDGQTYVLISLSSGSRWNEAHKAIEDEESYVNDNFELCVTPEFFYKKIGKGSVKWKRIGSWSELVK